MKKLILLSILVCCQWAAQAQVFAPEGSKWWYCESENLWPAPGYINVHSEIISYWGDTLINGLSYKKIGNQLTREAGDTIFVFNNGQDYVLHNFSLSVGDTIQFFKDKTLVYDWLSGGSFMTFQVTEKGKMTVQADSLRYYMIQGINSDLEGWEDAQAPFFDFLIVEKIGIASIYQHRVLPQIYCPTCSPSNLFLLKYEYSGNPDYYFPDPSTTSCGWLDVEEQSIQSAVSVYPNPVSDVLNLVSSYSEMTYTGYLSDIYGRKVMEIRPAPHSGTAILPMEHLPSGIYVLNLTDSKGNNHSEKIIKK